MFQNPRKLLKILFGTSFFLTVARFAGAGIGILLQILIARYYGAQVLGNYYLALSFAGIFSIFISMGYPWIIAPIISASTADKTSSNLGDFLGLVLKDTLSLFVLLGIPAALLIWYFPDMGDERRFTMLVGLATAPVYVAMRVFGAIANAMKLFKLANLPDLLFRPMLILFFVVIAILVPFQLGSPGIVLINFFISIGLLCWMAMQIIWGTDLNITGATTGKNISAPQKSKFRRLAVPMIFSTLFIFMFADLNLLLIALILPANEAGILGVAIKITALLVFAVQITHQILLRDASDAHFASDKQKMCEVVRKANMFAILSSFASFIVLLVLGKFILGLFGSQFHVAYYCLIGLSFAQIIRAAAGPAIQILTITENQRAAIPAYIASAIMLIFSNLLLVPAFKYNGAAAAVVITTLFWTVWLNRLVKQKTGYSTSIFG